MTREPPRHAESGLALVMVVLVLVALTLVVTPFALSMRHLESGALLERRRAEAALDVDAALTAARRHLADEHPARDVLTPHVDDAGAWSPAALAERFPDLLPRDPRGAIRSVRVEDERGKVHLGTAGPWLLGNLLGGRAVLTEALDEVSGVLTADDLRGFPEPGFAWIDGEQVGYLLRTDTTLDALRRGAGSANLPAGGGRAHAAGAEVLDARVLLLVQHGWHARAGAFTAFPRVDALRDIARWSELAYDAALLARVRPHLTVHGGPVRWEDARRVEGVEAGAGGRTELVVRDARRFGPGTTVRLDSEDGVTGWNMVVSAVDWGDAWRVGLLEPVDAAHRAADTVVRRLHRWPVNLASASREVLVALFAGVGRAEVADVVTAEEAAAIAVLLVQEGVAPDDPLLRTAAAPGLARGAFDEADLEAATAALLEDGYRPGRATALELTRRLLGLTSRVSPRRVSQRTAEALADRVLEARPASLEDLAALLARAVAAGELDDVQRTALLRNAVDPGDARVSRGTAPATFSSGDVYTLHAAASSNLPNGRERGRAFSREVVSVAPPGESARLVDSQADFDEALAPGSGWATRPALLAAGEVAGTPPPGALAAALDAREVPDRAGALVAGLPGPSVEGGPSFAALATVRDPLPRTLHFDEGAPGLTGGSPDGLSLEDRPLRLPLRELDPALLGAESGLLQPFLVEFWFEVDDPDAEVMLFDTGADVLENRVWILLRGGELSLRVSDGSIADFDARMEAGRPPPAGEIRYAFDDGLELRAGVPYHVSARVGGAADRALALFVDGVPRGRRVFTTHLLEDTDAVGVLDPTDPTTSRSHRLVVASTEGFPARGVLRVGWELVEYVDKTDGAFLLQADGSRDPFGGRARRATAGAEHEAGETVQLMGYTRPLGGDVAPTGGGNLAHPLAAWAVGELDPARLDDPILAQIPVTDTGGFPLEPVEITLGTGLLWDATSIPVRAPGGGSLEDVFQAAGGHAILFCDYGDSELVGQPYPVDGTGGTPQLPSRSYDDGNFGNGAWIGGAEVIEYAAFDGATLTGCERAREGIAEGTSEAWASPLKNETSPTWVTGVDQRWDDDRTYITTFDPALRGVLPNLPEEARVLVVPISIDPADGGLNEAYNPFPQERQADASPLVQVGLDFPDAGGGTEWIRWTTPTDDFLVRDDKQAVEEMFDGLRGTDTWVMETPIDDDLVEGLNERLAFRAQGFTETSDHDPGEPLLPVHVFGGAWSVTAFDPVLGAPGRHDVATLVGDDGEREVHTVNHAVTDDPEWGPSRALVAFREPVVGAYARTPDTTDDDSSRADVVRDRDLDAALRPGGPAARLVEELGIRSRRDLEDRLRPLNVDSRRITRLVKAPSGELPDALLEEAHLGRHHDGRPAGRGARVDELRVVALARTGPLVTPVASLRLERDLEAAEEELLVLSVEDVLLPHAALHARTLGADRVELLGELPGTGGLLLVDEEVVGYAGLDALDTGAVFLTGRGLFGTRRARHVQGAPVVPLVGWPASPLASALSPDDAVVPVADPARFPERGLLWLGDELVAWDGTSDDGLLLPTPLGRDGPGLLRGRFGTTPSAHAAGTIARWMPARVEDRGLLGDDVPEARALHLPVHAPGAFFTDVAVRARLPDDRVELVGRIALDGYAGRHDDPDASPDLVALPSPPPGGGTTEVAVGRQADLLELWLVPRWLPGAFDPRGFAGQGWKLGPRVDTVVVEHVQPTRVLEHEEWR